MIGEAKKHPPRITNIWGLVAACLISGLPIRLANAEPVLLATLNYGAGQANNTTSGPLWPAFAYWGEQVQPAVVIFEGFELAGPYPVTIFDTVSADNDPDFERFAALMTDGTNEGQELSGGAWGSNGLTVYGGGLEDAYFNVFDLNVPLFGVDFIGYEITHITQDLTVVLEHDWEGPTGSVYDTYFTYGGDYRFYGQLIPEPATLALLGLGCVMLKRRRPYFRG